MKVCVHCNFKKELMAFGKHRGRKDGYLEICKECRRQTRTDKQSKEYAKLRYERNKEKVAAQAKVRYEKNKESILARNKEYSKKWDKKNPEKRAGYWKKYYEKNKAHLLKANTQYKAKRMKNDPGFRAMVAVRKRLVRALKGERKFYSFMEKVGRSIQELRLHIESQFKPGMTWENYGNAGWHIDHILPLSKFDLSNEKDFAKAVHYTNLQPLWQKENIKKSNKVSPELSL